MFSCFVYLSSYCFDGCIGILKTGPAMNVAKICQLDILVPIVESIKFLADIVDTGFCSRMSIASQFLTTSDHNISMADQYL